MTEQDGWSEERLKGLLKIFGQHLVAMSGAYETLDEDQKVIEEKAYNFTGFVIAFKGNWFIVTAGHVLQNFERDARNEKVKITGRVLADYFGSEAKTNQPIPFDILEEPKVFIDDKSLGVDLGIIHLREYYRNLLKANGVIPAPFRQEAITDYSQFYGFSIFGFPEESVGQVGTTTGGQAVIGVQPHLVPISLSVEAPTDDSPIPRLIGQATDIGNLDSIVGMSGGPLFAYRQVDDDTMYEVIGVQSRWIKKSRTTFACPFVNFLNVVFEVATKLAEENETET